MVGMATRIRHRAITAAVLAVVGALSLGGCTGQGAGTASTAAGASSGSAAPTPVGSRVRVPCDTLVPAAAFGVYGKTFTPRPDATPKKGTTAAAIVEQRGVACIWEDRADDITVTVAVASLPAANLTRLKDTLFEDSHSVPTYTVEGYFLTRGGVGRADAFVDPYWVNVTSTMFGEPGDAQPVVDAARAALGPSDRATSGTD